MARKKQEVSPTSHQSQAPNVLKTLSPYLPKVPASPRMPHWGQSFRDIKGTKVGLHQIQEAEESSLAFWLLCSLI